MLGAIRPNNLYPVRRKPVHNGSACNLQFLKRNEDTTMSSPVNLASVAISGFATVIFHPTGYAKVLIQVYHNQSMSHCVNQSVKAVAPVRTEDRSA